MLHEFDEEHPLRLLGAPFEESLHDDGLCVVGDVCFHDREARDTARTLLAERWDPQEHYICAKELAAAARERGFLVQVEQLGPHAGVVTVARL